MQDQTVTTSSSIVNNGSQSDESSYFHLKRGVILLPSYGKDQESREKFWRMLTGEETPDSLRLVSSMEKENKNDRDGPKMESLFKIAAGSSSTPPRSNNDLRVKNTQSTGKSSPSNLNESGDNSKRLQEMTDQLRSLLHIGDASPSPSPTQEKIEVSTPKIANQGRVENHMKTPTPKSRSNFGSKPRPRMVSSSPLVSSTVRASPSSNGAEARVPYTARTPKPPPFLPSFSDDESDEMTNRKFKKQFSENGTISISSSDSREQILKNSASFTNGHGQILCGDDDDVVIWEEKEPKSQVLMKLFGQN